MKRTWFQAQNKQDIAISTQNVLPTREDHIAFLQKKAIHKHIYPKATKSIAIHLMSITRKVITSSLAYHCEQSMKDRYGEPERGGQ
jgi:hypothetical protein